MSIMQKSMFSRPGPVPFQTTPHLCLQLTPQLIPWSPRRHTRTQLHPKTKEKSAPEVEKTFPLLVSSQKKSLWFREGAQCLGPVTTGPFFIRGRRGTWGLDWVYIYSWEAGFPLGQCEDMSVWWQLMIRDLVCVCVYGRWRVMGTWVTNLFFNLLLWGVSPRVYTVFNFI